MLRLYLMTPQKFYFFFFTAFAFAFMVNWLFIPDELIRKWAGLSVPSQTAEASWESDWAPIEVEAPLQEDVLVIPALVESVAPVADTDDLFVVRYKAVLGKKVDGIAFSSRGDWKPGEPIVVRGVLYKDRLATMWVTGQEL